MTFRVGQKVVCVDAENGLQWSRRWVSVGEIYEIAAVYPADPNDGCADHLGSLWAVDLRGIMKPNGFGALRFRPVVERKTDISFAHEILRKASKPARGPAVTSPNRA
jgi:hypothetical protein